MTQVSKQTGKPLSSFIKMPDPVPELNYLYEYYWDIFSGQDLTFQEIESWSRLTARPLSPFEVDVIRSLDRTRKRLMRDD